jgi:hypothetical protein
MRVPVPNHTICHILLPDFPAGRTIRVLPGEK